MQTITVLACAVICIACTLGVFSHLFEDTLFQRVALAGCVLFSIAVARLLLMGKDVPYSVHGLIGCVAIHCLEVIRKVYMRHRQGKKTPADDFGKTIIMRRL